MAEEKSRKELLEEPDPFMVFVGKCFAFAKKHQMQMTAAAGTLLVLIIVISGVIYFKMKADDRASQLLGKAIAKLTAIQPSEASFIEYEATKKLFKDILDKYGSTGAGKAALLHYANLCYQTKAYDEAIKSYTEALDVFENKKEFKTPILSSLAYSYEGKENYEKAAAYFETIVADPNAVMNDQALFNLGRIYGKQGNTDSEKEMYSRIVAEYPDSMYFEIAKEKLAG